MRRELKIMALLFLTASFTDVQAGKPWPKLVDVVVRASVTMEAEGYLYSYAVSDSLKNELGIDVFAIDIRKIPAEHPFSSKHITIAHNIENHLKAISQGERIQPMRIYGPQPWKTFGRPTWNLMNSPGVLLVPGEIQTGFRISAKETPGIREFITKGTNYDFYSLPEQYDFSGTRDEMDAAYSAGIEFLGKTIAPVAPPEPFTVSSWTARMLADAQEARKLGWIKTDAGLKEIQKLLKTLNTKDINRLQKAVQNIEQYVSQEVKAGKLTEEADALVRLNALYLFKRLKESEKPKKK